MTQKTKQLKLFLTFTILAALLLYSCNIEEEVIRQDLYESNVKVSHVKFQNLIKQPDFNKAIAQIKATKLPHNPNTIANKTVMETQYGFTITDSNANVLENENFKSFTL